MVSFSFLILRRVEFALFFEENGETRENEKEHHVLLY